MSIEPTFSHDFGHSVRASCVVVGRFDGATPTLACATSGGRAFLHTGGAHAASPQLRFLNVNRDVTALGVAALVRGAGSARPAGASSTTAGIDLFDVFTGEGDAGFGGGGGGGGGVGGVGSGGGGSGGLRDALLIGSASALQAYDVDGNVDVLARDMPDSVLSLAAGVWPYSTAGGRASESDSSLATIFAGGQGSVTGVAASSRDAFWSSAGERVSALAFGDIDGDGRVEVLCGSADADLRAFRGADVVFESTETDGISALALIAPGVFAYGLSNGTLGVYAAPSDGGTLTRAWRARARSRVIALVAFDFDRSGVPDVAALWESGHYEIRRAATGELLFRDDLGAGGAGLVASEYRTAGEPLLLVVGSDGALRAYAQVDAATLLAYRTAAGLLGSAVVSAPAQPSLIAAAPPPPPPVQTAALPQALEESPEAASARIAAAEAAAREAAAAANARATMLAAAAAVANETAAIAAAFQEKAALEAKLREASATIAALNANRVATTYPDGVSADAKVSCRIAVDAAASAVDVIVTAVDPTTVLRAVTAWALDAAVFGSSREAAAAIAPTSVPSVGSETSAPLAVRAICVPLCPAVNAATTLTIRAHVGARAGARLFSVIEESLPLPRFTAFEPIGRRRDGGFDALPSPLPAGSVLLTVRERAQRIIGWLATSFVIPDEHLLIIPSAPTADVGSSIEAAVTFFGGGESRSPPPSPASIALDVRFLCARSGGRAMLRIAMASSDAGGALIIQTDDMALAGEVVSDLAAHLSITNMDALADFPGPLAALEATLVRVNTLSALRARITNGLAEATGSVKAAVVRAEDSRLRGDMRGVAAHYADLGGRVRELSGEYAIRQGVHTSLVSSLKEVNVTIQNAANLRGAEKTRCDRAVLTH